MSAPAQVVNATTANMTIHNNFAAPAAAAAESSSVATAVPVAAAAAEAPAPKRKRANGTGSVRQIPSGKWYGMYRDVSQRQGKRGKALHTKCFDTKEEAEEALDALVASVNAEKAKKLHKMAQERDHTRDLPRRPVNPADAEPHTAYYGAKRLK